MILAIFGAGGTGREVYNLIIKDKKSSSCFEKIVFVDDVTIEEVVHGIKVYRFAQIREQYSEKELKFLIALGDPYAREKIYNKIKKNGYSLSTWIHPKAEVADTATIGEGAIIMDAFIDTDVKIGDNTFIYYKAAIGHDSLIKENCIISAGSFVGGHSVIDKNVYFGPGAAVRDRLKIGKGAVIGINSAVYRDVPEEFSAIGNPAKIIPKSSKGLF